MFYDSWVNPTVKVTDLIRVWLPKNPTKVDGQWIINVMNQEQSQVQVMAQRFEFYSKEQGGYGMKQVTMRANAVGRFEIMLIATWGDELRMFLEVTE